MSENTTHVEGLEFSVLDDASPKAKTIASAFDRVSHATEGVRGKLKDFAKSAAVGALGAAGLVIGLRAIAEKAIAANRELNTAKETIAGSTFAFANWDKGTSAVERYRYSMEQASEVVGKLEESEGKLKIEQADLSKVYASAEQIGIRHRLGQAEMIDLTEKLAATEKVLGVNAESAALIISRASMTGAVAGGNKFGMMLKGALGDMKHFHKMTEPQRFAAIQKAMGDLVPAAQEMGKGWSGTWFDIKDSIEDAFRDLTGPVFKEVTKSLRSVAKHITEVQEGGKSLMQVYGEKMVSVFKTIKDITGWLVDHWKELAVIWATSKIGGSLGGIAGSLGGAGGVGSLGAACTGAAGKVAAFGSKLAGAATALGLWYEALSLGARELDTWQTSRIQKQSRWGGGSALEGSFGSKAARKMESFMERLERGGPDDWKEAQGTAKEGITAYRAAFGADAVSREGKVDVGVMRSAWETMSEESRMKQSRALGLTAKATEDEFIAKLTQMVGMMGELLPTPEKKKPPLAPGGPPVNHFHGDMHITQEFKEADPDRVFHRTIRDINDAAMHQRDSGVGALASVPGGMG